MDKGTNGGKPTSVDKINDGVDAVDAATSATKEVFDDKKKSADMIYTHKDDKDPNKDVQVRRDVLKARQKKKNEKNKK